MKKKRVIVFLFLISLMFVFTGCEDTNTETIRNEASTEIGTYCVFRTYNIQEYLSFLENFDDSKYEIIDISVSAPTSHMDEFYIITYKVK